MREITEDGELSRLAEQVRWTGELARAAVRAQLFGSGGEALSFGRYTWIGPLGLGGMGTVVVARDPALDREVAVKLVEADDARSRARVVREAQAIARISDPHVVEVYDVGVAERRVYIVMELVRGTTLRRWCSDAVRGWREIVRMFSAAGEGLAAVHRHGLVHRDFKPDNVVVGDDGRARLIDFGIARATIEPSPTGALPVAGLPVQGTLSGTAARAGTLAYIAPEQLDAGVVDHRADQFAFCVALWEALVGTRPGGRDSVSSITEFAGPPPRPRGRELPGRLYAVLARGLHVDPARRHADMATLLAALRRTLAPPLGRIGAASFGVVALLGLALVPASAPRDRCEQLAAAAAHVWDHEQRARIGESFTAVEAAFVDDAWTRVDHGLVEFVADWQLQRTAACRDDDPALADAEQRCFAWLLSGATSMVGELERVDAGRIAAAVERVASLVEPAACRDPAVLVGTPPAADPSHAGEVERIRVELAEVERSYARGDDLAALARAEQLAAQASNLDFEPLRLECALVLGTLHGILGPFEPARRDLAAVHADAEAIAYAAAASRAASELVRVELQLDDGEAALQWGRRAITAARASGQPELLDAAEGSIADALGYLGRHDEALRYYQGLLARLRQHCREPCAGRVDIEAEIATSYDALGERELALVHGHNAVELAETTYGDAHPSTGVARQKLCVALDSAGRRDEALHECERAHQVLAGAWGPHHPETAMALATFGVTEVASGAIEQGRMHLRAAHAELAIALGSGHPHAIGVLANLGWSYIETRELEAARELLASALQELAAIPDADPVAFAALHHNYATVMIELGHDAEAADSLARAIALRESVPGLRAEELVGNRTQLGGVLWRLGHHDAARDMLETAVYDERHDDVAFNRVLRRYYLAGVLTDRDPARALRLLTDALAIGGNDPELGELLATCVELRDRLQRRRAR